MGKNFFGSRKSRCPLRIRSECRRRHSHHQGFEGKFSGERISTHLWNFKRYFQLYSYTDGERGSKFREVLHDARELGYVEADESLDLDGVDAAHKAVILAYLAHGMWISLKDITVEGIRKISNEDLLAARKLGCKIKLIGVIRRNFENNHISVGIYPALVPVGEIIARTDGVYNGVSLTGTVVGTVVLTGRGAGQDPTAGSVISDIVDAVKGMRGMISQPKLLHVTPMSVPLQSK